MVEIVEVTVRSPEVSEESIEVVTTSSTGMRASASEIIPYLTVYSAE